MLAGASRTVSFCLRAVTTISVEPARDSSSRPCGASCASTGADIETKPPRKIDLLVNLFIIFPFPIFHQFISWFLVLFATNGIQAFLVPGPAAYRPSPSP